jgi:hypothetical protein
LSGGSEVIGWQRQRPAVAAPGDVEAGRYSGTHQKEKRGEADEWACLNLKFKQNPNLLQI